MSSTRNTSTTARDMSKADVRMACRKRWGKDWYKVHPVIKKARMSWAAGGDKRRTKKRRPRRAARHAAATFCHAQAPPGHTERRHASGWLLLAPQIPSNPKPTPTPFPGPELARATMSFLDMFAGPKNQCTAAPCAMRARVESAHGPRNRLRSSGERAGEGGTRAETMCCHPLAMGS